jgi:hypothetical protein
MLFINVLEPYSFPREPGLMGDLKIFTTMTVEEIHDEYTNNKDD